MLQFAFCTPVLGQALVVRTQDASEFLLPDGRLMVNGPRVHGDVPGASIAYGRFGRFIARFALLHMVERGAVKLDTPLFQILPHLLEENPFDVATNVGHLLTGTAGYAVPPGYKGGTVPSDMIRFEAASARYLLRQRLPGGMAYDDPVAAALMAAAVEKLANMPLLEALETWAAKPLLGAAAGFSIAKTEQGRNWFTALDGLTGSPELVIAASRALMQSTTLGLPELRARLLEPAWIHHALGATRTPALSRRLQAGHFRYDIPGAETQTGVKWAVFPDLDLAFIDFGREAGAPDFEADLQRLFAAHVPPGSKRGRLEEQAARMRYPSDIGGIFIREDAPTSQLRLRLERIWRDVIAVDAQDGDALKIGPLKGTARTFTPYARLAFRGAEGEEALFASRDRAGFITISDGEGASATYRRIGLLGDERIVLSPFLWAVALLLTSGLYVFAAPTPAFRRMGIFGLAGTLLALCGLYLELHYWAKALYEWDMPWLVTVWRLTLNIGLALVLSLPLFALSFARSTPAGHGIALLLIPMHLALLTAASLIFFLMLVAWGLAGQFAPY